MKELNAVQMEEMHGGTISAACFMFGLFGSLTLATGGLGVLVYGPAAVGAGIACFH